MPNVAKLKKKAADFELKKQFDKALAVYVELLANFDEHANELDVALFNRVGDILVRQGNVADAVDYYERAVDYYSEGGFFNNAIALCNKILRHSPGRTSIYYKLGKISAQKGFKNDAKQNFLEYADRMQKSGRIDEAFRALTEFADLCPDQDDIRLMLADQLTKAGRSGEAVEQLQLLHERYSSEGRTAEAAAAAARLRAIDPTIEPRAGSAAPQQASRDLVFLDLGEGASPRRTSPAASHPPQPAPPRSAPPRPAPPAPGSSRPAPPRPAPPRSPTPSALADLPLIHSGDDEPATPAAQPPEPAAKPPARPAAAPHARFAPRAAPPAAPPQPAPPAPPPEASEPEIELADALPEPADTDVPTEASIAGFETTQIPDDGSAGAESLLDMETTSFGGSDEITRGFPSAADSLLDMPDDPFGATPGSLVETPAAPIFDLGEGLLDDSVEVPLDLDEGPPATHAGSSVADEEGLDLVLSDGLESPSPSESGELLAELEPPISREEPAPQTEAELPLLDFEVPAPAGRPGRRASAAVPELTLADDLDSAQPESAEEIEVDLSIEEESEAAPIAPRSATLFAARSVEVLQAAVESDPENWGLHRELGEAMLESGDRDGGIQELETAMLGAEHANDLDLAGRIAEEITRIDPGTIRHLQKRVEYAFRTNDRPRLIEAYLDLGEALSGTEQRDKARAVYQRVLELAPDDIRAQAALEALPQPAPEQEPEAQPARRVGGSGRSAAPRPRRSVPTAPVDPDSFVNLGDILRDEVGPADTRMVVEEHEPTGDEEADFQDMLRKFKQGIAQNVDQEDYQAHYDLGVAFKEMGLVNEAIAEFQKALRAPSNRVPTYEALGQCFIEKEQYSMASTVLSRALNEERSTDDQLVGVLYLLGRAAEALNRADEALTYYQRVFLVDIEFQDVASRVRELERVAR